MCEPELKDNLCEVKFRCFYANSYNCVHHKNKGVCKHFNGNTNTCKNTIAHVQAVTKYLKSIGLELKQSTEKF